MSSDLGKIAVPVISFSSWKSIHDHKSRKSIERMPYVQELLKENKIGKIYFVGFTTDHCVAETMNTLISDGYECILVSDCTAARNSKIQQKIENKYTSVNSKQIIEEISD